jgi:glycosyltransferase involved in cell wall biosynthesis
MTAGIREVRFVSTWNTHCGIADYTASLRAAVEGAGIACETVEIDRSVTSYLSRLELASYFEELGRRCAGADVVHIQHEYSFFAGRFGIRVSMENFERVLRRATASAAAVVVTFHSVPPVPGLPRGPWRPAARQLALQLLWRRQVVPWFRGRRVWAIAPSRLLRGLLIDSGIPAQQVVVIPQGSASPAPTGSGGDAAKLDLGYPADARLMVQYGFVSRHKGHQVAVDSLRRLPERYHLAVVGGVHPMSPGDGYYESVLRSLGRRPEIAKRVRLTGWVPAEEAGRYAAAADVMVLPYVDDNLVTSAAMMWALAASRPVVATKISAFREIAAEGKCLELVDPHAPRELADAVLRVERDQALAGRLVASAAEYCGERTWDRIARRHIDLYSTARGRRGAGG